MSADAGVAADGAAAVAAADIVEDLAAEAVRGDGDVDAKDVG